MAETAEQQRARQRANSLKEQRQKLAKTGRVTKGLANSGYLTVNRQEYTVENNDSPFSVAERLLGPSATQSQIAAFVQSQGWNRPFRSGDVIKVRGALLAPDARPTSAFMANVRGEGAAYNSGYWNSETGVGGVGGNTTGAGVTLPSSGMVAPPVANSGVPSLPSQSQYQQSERTQTPIPAVPNAYRQSETSSTPANRTSITNPNAGGSPVLGLLQRVIDAAWSRPNAAAGRLQGSTVAGNASLNGINQRQLATDNTPAYLRGIQADPNRPNNLPQNYTQQQVESARLTGIALNDLAAAAVQTDDIGRLIIGSNGGYITDTVAQLAVGGDPVAQQNFQTIYYQPAGPGTNWVVRPEVSATLATLPTSSGGLGFTGGNDYTGWRASDAIGVQTGYRPRRGGAGSTGNAGFQAVPAIDYSYGGQLASSWNVGF